MAFMTDILILAAGLGTRMKSRRAKVLHEVAGRPLVCHVVRAASELSPEALFIVVGHQADDVESVVRQEASVLSDRRSADFDLQFILQEQQHGTGHAVMAARDQLKGRPGPLVILAGDGPMIQGATLGRLVDTHAAERNDVTLLTVCMDDPHGYGRIIRDDGGRFVRCVEQKDASPEEKAVQEVAVSIYCFNTPALLEGLDGLTTNNAQGEYYLTDVPRVMLGQGRRVGLVRHSDPGEVLGVNTRVELAELDRKLRARKLQELMLSGVTIVDPASTYVDQDVEIGQDTIIHPQVIIEGATRIGSDCTVSSWTRIRNCSIGNSVTIRNSCVLEDSTIHTKAAVGPFARLRKGAEIGENAAIGNFVEVKKSTVGRGTKASHLSYLGDARLGDRVNIGAGTVTCNYDGVRKNETIIEDDVKIGSDTMLVAPVRVGRGSVTGAGSVVTKDIPPDSLAVGIPATVKKKVR
jgi:bifunctional UDP-N-acetylglucosamine pyrophosphorylase/glucosamine-1-phosphate N-acetyltransferase